MKLWIFYFFPIFRSHTGFFASKIIANQGNYWGMESKNHLFLTKKTCGNTLFLNPKPIKETLGIILKKAKKIIEGATVVKFVNKVQKLQYLH